MSRVSCLFVVVRRSWRLHIFPHLSSFGLACFRAHLPFCDTTKSLAPPDHYRKVSHAFIRQIELSAVSFRFLYPWIRYQVTLAAFWRAWFSGSDLVASRRRFRSLPMTVLVVFGLVQPVSSRFDISFPLRPALRPCSNQSQKAFG